MLLPLWLLPFLHGMFSLLFSCYICVLLTSCIHYRCFQFIFECVQLILCSWVFSICMAVYWLGISCMYSQNNWPGDCCFYLASSMQKTLDSTVTTNYPLSSPSKPWWCSIGHHAIFSNVLGESTKNLSFQESTDDGLGIKASKPHGNVQMDGGTVAYKEKQLNAVSESGDFWILFEGPYWNDSKRKLTSWSLRT